MMHEKLVIIIHFKRLFQDEWVETKNAVMLVHIPTKFHLLEIQIIGSSNGIYLKKYVSNWN